MKNLLRLYVVGNTPAAEMAQTNIQTHLRNVPDTQWELEVIDVLEKPELADEDRIVAVPALIKKLPPPVRRYVGDMASKEHVLLGLDVRVSE